MDNTKMIDTNLTDEQKNALQKWSTKNNKDLTIMLNEFFECVQTHQIKFSDSGENQCLAQEMKESIQKIKHELKKLLDIKKEDSIFVKSSLIQIFDEKLCFECEKIFTLISKVEIQFIHCEFFATKENFPIGWEGSGRVFEKKLFFHNCTFKEFISFSSSTFKEAIEFNNSTFVGSVDFHESTFEKNACFYGVNFGGVPNFSQANFLQKVNLVNTDLNFSFEKCREIVEKEKERRINQRSKTLKMGKPIVGAKIANDFRDSFRLFKGNLIDEHNQLDAANYRKIELYFKEIEMEESLEKFNWEVLKKNNQKLFGKLNNFFSLHEMSLYVEYSLLKFYRKVSDHHLGLFNIINIFIFFIAFHSVFVFGTMWGAKNFFMLGTEAEIRYIEGVVFYPIVITLSLWIIIFLFSYRKIELVISIRLLFPVLLSIFVFRFSQPFLSSLEYADFKSQLILFIVSFSFIALYCSMFLTLYFMFKYRLLRNFFYFLSYPLFIIFFLIEPHIVAPVLGVFQEQKTNNIILEKYIQTTKFSELKDLVKNCETLNQQIDWTHDQFRQVRQVLLKHSDEFLFNTECFKQNKEEDQRAYEAKARHVSIMVFKNMVLNNALKTINIIYLIIVALLLFSLIKTARKNSIVPN